MTEKGRLLLAGLTDSYYITFRGAIPARVIWELWIGRGRLPKRVIREWLT
jgi:hypothetical protein